MYAKNMWIWISLISKLGYNWMYIMGGKHARVTWLSTAIYKEFISPTWESGKLKITDMSMLHKENTYCPISS